MARKVRCRVCVGVGVCILVVCLAPALPARVLSIADGFRERTHCQERCLSRDP